MTTQHILKELTNDEVKQILELEESWTIDKKGKEIMPSKLSKTVSAFANSNGGEIFLGISHYKEDKNSYYWDGFDNIESANQFVDIIACIVPNYEDCVFEYLYVSCGKNTYPAYYNTQNIISGKSN